MSDHYHDENDLKLMRDMRKLAPDDFNAWLGLNNIVARENGAIPRKYRELIAIAVSATTQCPYCMEAHAKAAHNANFARAHHDSAGCQVSNDPCHDQADPQSKSTSQRVFLAQIAWRKARRARS